MASQRWHVFVVAGFWAGAGLGLLGCPGKDTQELKPLADLRAEAASEAQGAAPAGAEASRAEKASAEYGEPWTEKDFSPSTGSTVWRGNPGGRNADLDVTFGPGVEQAAPGGRWAYNTDSTGGAGDVLGTGVTYGASGGLSTFAAERAASSAEPAPAKAPAAAKAPATAPKAGAQKR